VDELMATYEASVGRGGQLMLGLAPDDRGLLPDADVARLKEFGEAIRARYANNLALKHLPADANTANALDGDTDTFWSAPPGSHRATLEVTLKEATTFDRALTMERLNDGQHVQKYRIEAWVNGGWKALAEGSAIGHKKIDAFEAVTASRVRLEILSSTNEAQVREFELFNTGGR